MRVSLCVRDFLSRVVVATLAAGVAMGQQEYELQLLRHLPKIAPDLEFRHVRVRWIRSSLPGEARLPLRVLPRLPRAVQLMASRYAYGAADVVHRNDFRLPPGRNEVVTVHDLASLRFADEGTIPPGADAALRRAKAIICPSQFAASELASVFGIENATVIYNGLDPAVWLPAPHPQPTSTLPSRFVLHSGGSTKRKNLRALAEAWTHLAALQPDVELVMCGPPHPRRDALFDHLPRVRKLGRVQRTEHLALMRAATVVVIPSIYEGFGFPALEAMALGTAVVAARSASLPEICGDAALLVPPTGDGIGAGLVQVLTDQELRNDLEFRGPTRAQGFTWEKSARLHAEVFRSVSGKAGRPQTF